MKYTAKEVRDWHLARAREQRNIGCSVGVENHKGMADAIDAHIAGMGEPVAYQSKRRPEDYPDEWRECSKETFDTIKRMKDSPWIVRELFDRPPAQAAQVDQVGELLAIIHGDGGHYQAEHGLQKAAKDAQEKVIQMMTKIATSEPVAQGEPVAGIQVPREGLPRVAQFIPYPAWLRLPPGIHGLFTTPPAPPAQTVDVGAIREVIDILQADGAPFGVKPLADRLTRALTGEKAGRADGWLPIDTAPKGKPVLVHYINGCGKGRTIKARYVDRFTEESSPDSECDEYNEENDTYYTLPGWYEMIDNWDEYSLVFVHHDPILWHPLPASPAPDKNAELPMPTSTED